MTDFSLDSYTGVIAKIPAGSMRGGKTYNVKVIAQVAGNSAVDPVEASITITTRSMDLIPVIRKGPVIVIGRCKEAFTDS